MERELILNFHGIGTPHPHVEADERDVWMSRERFVAILDRLSAVRAASPIPIRITFDDGNASDTAIALPELVERNLSATFFICAGRLRSPKYLGPPAVHELLKAGMQVGSHGMHHRNWRQVDATTLAEEIGTARKLLGDVSGRPVTEAAIPFGSYDRRVLAQLKAEKYTVAYTSDRGLAHRDAWLKPRNTLGAMASPDDVDRLLSNQRPLRSALRHVYGLYKRIR